MTSVVLFHHVLGLTAGVKAFADTVRAHGHAVHTPDLFEGRIFDRTERGAAYADSLGFDEIIGRGEAAAAALPNGVVYAGMSMGVLPAQKLAQTDHGARGALLLESCVPVSAFSDEWPAGVPVQVHGMDEDDYFVGEGDIDAARALVAEAGRSASAELFLYSGSTHLFTDSSLVTYDKKATALVTRRVLQFLETLE